MNELIKCSQLHAMSHKNTRNEMSQLHFWKNQINWHTESMNLAKQLYPICATSQINCIEIVLVLPNKHVHKIQTSLPAQITLWLDGSRHCSYPSFKIQTLLKKKQSNISEFSKRHSQKRSIGQIGAITQVFKRIWSERFAIRRQWWCINTPFRFTNGQKSRAQLHICRIDIP